MVRNSSCYAQSIYLLSMYHDLLIITGTPQLWENGEKVKLRKLFPAMPASLDDRVKQGIGKKWSFGIENFMLYLPRPLFTNWNHSLKIQVQNFKKWTQPSGKDGDFFLDGEGTIHTASDTVCKIPDFFPTFQVNV